MSAAIGTSSASSQTPEGAIWFDVRNFGAKADNGVTDNAGPIQATIDALVAKMGTNTDQVGVVYIPNAPLPYVVSKTIWVDHPGIEVRGDGWGSQIYMSNKHNVFQFGARRTEYLNGVPRTIDATYRPDAFGKLDTSAAPATGTRWGIRTNNDAFVQIQASPLSSGIQSVLGPNNWDNWTETTTLTVEFCIQPPAGQSFPANANLLGMGVGYYQPCPFTVTTPSNPQQLLITFKTADFSPIYGSGSRAFYLSLAGATAPYRVAFQIDLNNAVCSAYLNGTQVALLTPINLTSTATMPFTAGAGLRFQQNDYYPMMIGEADAQISYSGTTGVDMQLYGLRLSNTLRYQNNAPGQPQTRVDAPTTAINDAYSYFTNDAHTIGFLQLTDNPATAGRTVSVQHGNTVDNGGVGSGLFLHAFSAGNLANNAIRDLYVCAGSGFGQAISIGAVYEMTVDHVKAFNGFHGIGSLNFGANYYIYVDDCTLQGCDAAYYGDSQLIRARNLNCEASGRATIRLYGCSGTWENVFVSFAQANAECYFKLHSGAYGTTHWISNFLADFEGNTLSRAAIYCEANVSEAGPCTTLTLRDVFFGTVGATTPLVMLKDMGPPGNPVFSRGSLLAENLQANTNQYLAAVEVDGPGWIGDVRSPGIVGPRFNHQQTWGARTAVAIRETTFTAPPRAYLWYAGAHVLEVRSPVDGQFAEWRCMTTGTYGTTTPPVWVGLNPVSLSPSGLAGYVLTQQYMTAALS